jgi:hypothetical protein
MSDAPWAARWVYFFDGTSGCERCKGVHGVYDNQPTRPHPHCDCPIYEGPLWGFQDIIYKEKSESEEATYDMPIENVAEYINESDNTVEHTLTVSATINGEVGVSADIEDAFGVSGKYSGSETVSESVKVTLEPEQGVAIDVIGLMKQVKFSAKKYAVYEPLIQAGGGDNAPSTIEVFLGQVSDEITAVTGHRIVTKNI